MANNKLDLATLSTKMELLEMRVKALEKLPPDKLEKRLEKIEAKLYKTKEVWTFDEVCEYLGVSASQVYKLTMNLEIPHYKPRGKMIYFDRKEIIKWMKKNHFGGATVKKKLEAAILNEDSPEEEPQDKEDHGKEE